jgi:hypothetical protein
MSRLQKVNFSVRGQANSDSERCVVGAYCNTPLQVEIITRSPVPASCIFRVATFCRRLIKDNIMAEEKPED